MKAYEIMSIYNVDLGDQGAKDLSKKVAEVITTLGGAISKTDYWGKRRFAYEIKNKEEGYFDVSQFDLEPSDLEKLKTKLNLTAGVVRYLITARD